MLTNYYSFFGISKDATFDEIKQAYRRLAHKYHPDKNKSAKSAEEKMKEINFIYSILSNPYKRKSYDETVGAMDYFDKFDWNYSANNPFVDIYCDSLDVVDSTRLKTKIKIGQRIFYSVEIDRSVITWKYKHKEYFDMFVKKIFNPVKRDLFSKVLEFNFNKEPLCLVSYGKNDVVIYYEDFKSFWLSEENYKKIDTKKGYLTALIVGLMLIFGVYYIFETHPITNEQKNSIKQGLTVNETDSRYRNFLKEEYLATDGEINYIMSGRYEVCTGSETKITERTEVKNAPDLYALGAGELLKDTKVKILLYYPDKDAYKIQEDKIIGWVSAKFMENPICDTDQE